MIRSKLLKSALLSFTFLISGCQEDPEAAANGLFVEAATSLQQAESITGDSIEQLMNRRDLLKTAVTNLDEIVKTYPAASLAVDLVSAGRAKGIVVSEVKQQLEDVQRALACLETGQQGKCVVDDLIKSELSRDFDIRRRWVFVWLAVSDKRWDEAFELAAINTDRTMAQQESLDIIGAFAVLFDEPNVIERAMELTADRNKGNFERYLNDLRADLNKNDWKLTVNLSPTFTAQAAPDLSGYDGTPQGYARIVLAVLEGADTAIKSGDMETLRSKIVGSVVVLNNVLNAGYEDHAREATDRLVDGLYGAIRSVFP